MGTGIWKIRLLTKETGVPEPHFEFGNFFTVTFYRPVLKPLNKFEKLGEKLGENDLKVLNLLRQNKNASIVSIAEETKLSTTGIEKIISRLKKKKLLNRIGPAKGGRWEVLDGK